ncbi:hypothetical protein CHARACLAT_023175 [Characodon lateralis]|uniref:Uncharacterized protein n=1 Tax=Characodon lateralis TaxID=208331 RepID=A0ABU7E6Z9_9TELE|nr:hypothetical protein [Characodon lateralis]
MTYPILPLSRYLVQDQFRARSIKIFRNRGHGYFFSVFIQRKGHQSGLKILAIILFYYIPPTQQVPAPDVAHSHSLLWLLECQNATYETQSCFAEIETHTGPSQNISIL